MSTVLNVSSELLYRNEGGECGVARVLGFVSCRDGGVTTVPKVGVLLCRLETKA